MRPYCASAHMRKPQDKHLTDNFAQVGPSIGATYGLYALLVQDWGVGGIRSFSHSQDEAALAAGTET